MIHITHLETDLTHSCQLSCVACNHFVPLWRTVPLAERVVRVDQIEKDLNGLARFLHTDAWAALGGEPLLSPDIQDVLKIARASGIADEIHILTNGLLLSKQPDSLWDLVDFIYLSVYEGKHTPESIDWIVRKCADHGVRLQVAYGAGPNFQPILETKSTTPSETVEKFNTCYFRWNCRAANDGYFFTCGLVHSISRLVQKIPHSVDGILIETTTEAELRAYLERTNPLEACKGCAGRDRAPNITWSEEHSPKEWLRKSRREL